MFQARDHTASSKSKTRGRGRGKTLKTMFKTMASHLRRGMRSDKEEPLPPTAPGTYSRTVSCIDGSIEYVKVGSQVINPAQCNL